MNTEKYKAFTGIRKDILDLVRFLPSRVLDIGCSNRINGRYLIDELQVGNVVGMEGDSKLAEEASERLDLLTHPDVMKYDFSRLPSTFDLIILVDVIEHVAEPAELVERATDKLSEVGKLIISVPNTQHWTAI